MRISFLDRLVGSEELDEELRLLAESVLGMLPSDEAVDRDLPLGVVGVDEED
jgi:hypothetical protein